ncbi:hypothetical protein ACH4SK_17370 [Streptomyces inhibens]|uniref:hypothetical protein n=1 Tax=Streptomyces inhibens TaxID=2293571 RepID=UPI0037948A19
MALLIVPFVIGLGLVPMWMSQRGGDANATCDGKAMRAGDICGIWHGALAHHYSWQGIVEGREHHSVAPPVVQLVCIGIGIGVALALLMLVL